MQKSVLIADDSPTMRRTIAEILIDDGWLVAGEAVDGREAVDLYKRLRPDAVTMDIAMPGTDGIEAMAEIREHDPGAKVVVVSAMNQTSLISKAIRTGAQDFIAKPFLADQVRETMRIAAEAADDSFSL